MKTFDEFLLERNSSCKEIPSTFKFTGTIADNEIALMEIYNTVQDSNCEDLTMLYCCIEEHIKRNFCKSNNYTRVNDEDKRLICAKLSLFTKTSKKRLGLLLLDIPNCSKRY